MTPVNYLSTKKTSNLNISISPALKDWIQRFFNKKNDEFPNNENYKSLSAFICNIMENVLKIFEKGKTLDDFKKVMDEETNVFFRQYNVMMLGPFLDYNCELHKYTPVEFKSILSFLLRVRSMLMKDIDPHDPKSFRLFFEKMRTRYLYGNLTKDIIFDIFTDDSKHEFRAIIEHTGTYKNIHYYNGKLLASILGIFGLELTDFIHSEEEIYYRMDMVPTELFYNNKLLKKERVKLLKANVKFLTNYNRILDVDSEHLWIAQAQDKNLYVSFKNLRTFNQWIKKIEDDLQIYGEKENFTIKMLKYFEKIHWIRILDTKQLSFQLDLSNEENEKEIQYLFDYLSKSYEFSRDNGIYYIERARKNNKSD